MIGIVIADDEIIIREGLESIPWSSYGIELKGVASNGIEAMDLIKSTMPEILLTDIRMPGMDGLELISAAKAVVPNIKAILLTGYKDFTYAHSAIRLAACGYILKPSKPDEIVSAVLKVKEMTDAERNDKLEKERISKQIASMQDIIRNTLLVDSLKDTPENESLQEIASGEFSGIEKYHVQNRIVQKVLDYIDRYYMHDITLISASEHVFMNHFYLSRLIKKETGENFLEILTRTRLRKACEMLGDVNMKAYEVAGKVGIRDSGYFSQVFKKYFGMTPSEYREQIITPKKVRI